MNHAGCALASRGSARPGRLWTVPRWRNHQSPLEAPGPLGPQRGRGSGRRPCAGM